MENEIVGKFLTSLDLWISSRNIVKSSHFRLSIGAPLAVFLDKLLLSYACALIFRMKTLANYGLVFMWHHN